MSNDCNIPTHLPKRLTISFWLWNYFYGIKKGDVFHNLEQRFVELKERGFNSIRIDAGAGLCHTPQGTPRGSIVLRKPFQEYSGLIKVGSEINRGRRNYFFTPQEPLLFVQSKREGRWSEWPWYRADFKKEKNAKYQSSSGPVGTSAEKQNG